MVYNATNKRLLKKCQIEHNDDNNKNKNNKNNKNRNDNEIVEWMWEVSPFLAAINSAGSPWEFFTFTLNFGSERNDDSFSLDSTMKSSINIKLSKFKHRHRHRHRHRHIQKTKRWKNERTVKLLKFKLQTFE
jgi:hypothetical protein